MMFLCQDDGKAGLNAGMVWRVEPLLLELPFEQNHLPTFRR